MGLFLEWCWCSKVMGGQIIYACVRICDKASGNELIDNLVSNMATYVMMMLLPREG